MQINIPTEKITRAGHIAASRIKKIRKWPKWAWFVVLGLIVAGTAVWIILTWPEPPKPDYPIVEAQPVVIDDVGKVVGRKAIPLQNDDVHVVVLEFDVAPDQIVEGGLEVVVPHRFVTDDVALAILDPPFNLVQGKIAVPRINSVISRQNLAGLLGFLDLEEILGGGEVDVGLAFDKKVLDGPLVDIGP